MNVLHFINNLDREGAQVMVSNLVSAASDTAIRYIVCVRRPGGTLIAELREQGIEVIEPPQYYGFKSIPRSVRFLSQVCQDNNINIIHAHMADTAFLGWLAARRLKLPLVISHHGHDILMKCNVICRLVYLVLLNLSARFAMMNIAVSPSVAEQMRKLLLIDDDYVRVISNGVRIPDSAQLEDKKEYFESQSQSLTLVTVGRLVPLKGHQQLIHAVKKILEHYSQLNLYIVGGGPLEAQLKQLAAETGVEKNIHFTGAVDDVSVYLSKADLYVSTSLSEGMPVSVLEAMAWRVPVITSDIPGNRSVVKQAETGFLYPLNDIEVLANTILSVAKDSRTYAVAVKARLMVKQEFSAEACEQKHAILYATVTG